MSGSGHAWSSDYELVSETCTLVYRMICDLGDKEPRLAILQLVMQFNSDMAATAKSLFAEHEYEKHWIQSYSLCASCLLGDLFSVEPIKYSGLTLDCFNWSQCLTLWKNRGFREFLLTRLDDHMKDIRSIRNSFVNHVFDGDQAGLRGFHLTLPVVYLDKPRKRQATGRPKSESPTYRTEWLSHLTYGEGSLIRSLILACSLCLIISVRYAREDLVAAWKVLIVKLGKLSRKLEGAEPNEPGYCAIGETTIVCTHSGDDVKRHFPSVCKTVLFRVKDMCLDLYLKVNSKINILHASLVRKQDLATMEDRTLYVMEFVIATCYRAILCPKDRSSPHGPFVRGALPIDTVTRDKIFGSYVHVTKFLLDKTPSRLSFMEVHLLLKELTRLKNYLLQIISSVKFVPSPKKIENTFRSVWELRESLLLNSRTADSSIKPGTWAESFYRCISVMAKAEDKVRLTLKASPTESDVRQRLSTVFEDERVDEYMFDLFNDEVQEKRVPLEELAFKLVRGVCNSNGTLTGVVYPPISALKPSTFSSPGIHPLPMEIYELFIEARKKRIYDGPHDLLVSLVRGSLSRGELFGRLLWGKNPDESIQFWKDLKESYSPATVLGDSVPLYFGTDFAEGYAMCNVPEFPWNDAKSMGMFFAALTLEKCRDNAVSIAIFKVQQNKRLLDGLDKLKVLSLNSALKSALLEPVVVRIDVPSPEYHRWLELNEDKFLDEDFESKISPLDAFRHWMSYQCWWGPRSAWCPWYYPLEYPMLEYSVNIGDSSFDFDEWGPEFKYTPDFFDQCQALDEVPEAFKAGFDANNIAVHIVRPDIPTCGSVDFVRSVEKYPRSIELVLETPITPEDAAS